MSFGTPVKAYAFSRQSLGTNLSLDVHNHANGPATPGNGLLVLFALQNNNNPSAFVLDVECTELAQFDATLNFHGIAAAQIAAGDETDVIDLDWTGNNYVSALVVEYEGAIP